MLFRITVAQTIFNELFSFDVNLLRLSFSYTTRQMFYSICSLCLPFKVSLILHSPIKNISEPENNSRKVMSILLYSNINERPNTRHTVISQQLTIRYHYSRVYNIQCPYHPMDLHIVPHNYHLCVYHLSGYMARGDLSSCDQVVGGPQCLWNKR